MEAKKSLGQHFLHDASVLGRIKKEVEGSKRIVEIGGGRGALTGYLAQLDVPLTVVEMDDGLFLYLKEQFDAKGVKIVKGDASFFKLEERAVVVGNLPYNVSKRIIKNMILQKEKVEKMVFMVQKEVADSIVAKPKTKQYTKFSVFVQLFCKVEKLFNVKKGAFIPQPKVESSVVKLVPYETNALDKKIDEKFFKFLDVLFAHPRKTVKNNIKSMVDSAKNVSDFLGKRPEELSIGEIYKLYSGCFNE